MSNINQYQDELPVVERLDYAGVAKGWTFIQTARLLFGATAKSVAVSIFCGLAYGIPALFIFILGVKNISYFVQWVAFKIIPKNKGNRWMMNSCLNVFWNIPFILMIPGIVIFLLIIFFTIPYAFISVLFFDKSIETGAILFLNIYGPALESTHNMSATAQLMLMWDPHSITLSIIRLIGIGSLPFFYYCGHFDCTAEEFITSNDDTPLIYEKWFLKPKHTNGNC